MKIYLDVSIQTHFQVFVLLLEPFLLLAWLGACSRCLCMGERRRETWFLLVQVHQQVYTDATHPLLTRETAVCSSSFRTCNIETKYISMIQFLLIYFTAEITEACSWPLEVWSQGERERERESLSTIEANS